MSRLVLCFLFLPFFIFRVVAGETSLEGNQTQGGLVFGMTEPGSRVVLDGEALGLSGDGRFLIGFGRDAAKEATLSITGPDGKTDTRILKVVARTYKVQRIDGLPSRKVTPKPQDAARIRADNAGIGRVRALDTHQAYFSSGFMWPVTGPLSGVFGSQRILNGKPKNPHNGTDIAVPEGIIIKAPADGVVALVHDDMFYTGKTLMLDHGFGLTSVYAHMSALLVNEGDLVKKGTPIGKVGKTGRVSGAHLHWGVTLNRTHLDPALIAGDMN